MRTLIRALAVASSALALAAATGPAASADSPVVLEPFSFQFSEQDALMTEACGFPVQVTIVVSGIDRTFDPWPGGLAFLGTAQEEITFSVGTKTVTFHERAQEQVRANRDGTFSFAVTGRSFGTDSIGRYIFDPFSGETTFLAGKNVDYDALCAALSA
jgi:hypothetical protein